MNNVPVALCTVMRSFPKGLLCFVVLVSVWGIASPCLGAVIPCGASLSTFVVRPKSRSLLVRSLHRIEISIAEAKERFAKWAPAFNVNMKELKQDLAQQNSPVYWRAWMIELIETSLDTAYARNRSISSHVLDHSLLSKKQGRPDLYLRQFARGKDRLEGYVEETLQMASQRGVRFFWVDDGSCGMQSSKKELVLDPYYLLFGDAGVVELLAIVRFELQRLDAPRRSYVYEPGAGYPDMVRANIIQEGWEELDAVFLAVDIRLHLVQMGYPPLILAKTQQLYKNLAAIAEIEGNDNWLEGLLTLAMMAQIFELKAKWSDGQISLRAEWLKEVRHFWLEQQSQFIFDRAMPLILDPHLYSHEKAQRILRLVEEDYDLYLAVTEKINQFVGKWKTDRLGQAHYGRGSRAQVEDFHSEWNVRSVQELPLEAYMGTLQSYLGSLSLYSPPVQKSAGR
ncbi:MAG: hypothetical protein HY537_00400 [Deltaproteobacteria bacterium]|nr:hypothetical protein [Deltaproteobacteria bacterium]